MAQIPLSLHLDTRPDFEIFVATGNELAVAALAGVRPPGLMLDGPPATGKSHLLLAFAEAEAATYVSMRELMSPSALDGLTRARTLALDDVDAVLGDADWEHALFALVEHVVSAGGRILVSAEAAARHLEFQLPDLGSRLMALPAFRLVPLDDNGKLEALQRRSAQRGLTPDAQALRFLIERTERDMHSLTRLLDALDRQSWETGRRLTLPFIRAYLDGVSVGSPE